MFSSGSARDDLTHERPPQIVAPYVEKTSATVKAHFHPRSLNVVDEPIERDTRHRMDQYHLVPCWSRTSSSAEIDRRTHVDEWQRDHLGESTGSALDFADDLEMPGP